MIWSQKHGGRVIDLKLDNPDIDTYIVQEDGTIDRQKVRLGVSVPQTKCDTWAIFLFVDILILISMDDVDDRLLRRFIIYLFVFSGILVYNLFGTHTFKVLPSFRDLHPVPLPNCIMEPFKHYKEHFCLQRVKIVGGKNIRIIIFGIKRSYPKDLSNTM